MVTSKTKKVGLMSWPVGHSMSPVMHNAAFEALGLDWVYLPLPVQPEAVAEGIAGLKALTFEGCNVSVPLKSLVIPYLDEIDDAAKHMGAVNTIKNLDGKLYGTNTDPIGFMKQLESNGVNPEGMKILFIGAGGAARAAVYALAQAKVRSVILLDVVESQAAKLVNDLSSMYAPNSLSGMLFTEANLMGAAVGVDLVVNASPIGMAPKADQTPWPEHIKLSRDVFFFDIVYNPQETHFLKRAASEGCKTIGGLGMLVYQGAASFEIWTGQKPPIDVMFTIAEETLNAMKEKR